MTRMEAEKWAADWNKNPPHPGSTYSADKNKLTGKWYLRQHRSGLPDSAIYC